MSINRNESQHFRAGRPGHADDAPVALTPTEFSLLRTLLRAPGKVFSRAELLETAYEDTVVSERTVDSHVKGIRRQFGSVDPAADPIETVFGVGYRVRSLP